MTIEEKVRAYDEALKKARKLLNMILDNELIGFPDQIREIFPQLTESEDERIRKALIEGVRQIRCKNGITQEQMVAYLEKQKDASKAIEAVERVDKYIDEHLANAHDMKDSNPDKKYYRGWDDALGEMSRILQDVYSGEKQKEEEGYEAIPVESTLEYKLGFKAGKESEKQKEQKPWKVGENAYFDPNTDMWFIKKEQKPVKPSDDELQRYQDELHDFKVFVTKQAKEHDISISFVHDFEWNNFCAELLFHFNEQKPADWSEEDEKMISTLVSYVEDPSCWNLKYPREKLVAFIESLPKRFSPQPKQELSKEDEKFVHGLIRGLTAMRDIFGRTTFSSDNLDITETINWLKSIRPSWKPSEEQMKQLHYALTPGSAFDCDILNELYRQLRKLM